MDYQYSNFPLGLAAAERMGDELSADKRRLTEAEKEEIFFRSKDARNEEEAEKIKSSVSDWEDLGELFNGPGIG